MLTKIFRLEGDFIMKGRFYLESLYDKLIKKFPEHITIEQASVIAGVSKSKLKSDFLQEYGMPYYSYFRYKRIKYAAELLIETDLRIMDIAVAAGYDNCNKFTKAFKDIIGCSPSQYRRDSIKR